MTSWKTGLRRAVRVTVFGRDDPLLLNQEIFKIALTFRGIYVTVTAGYDLHPVPLDELNCGRYPHS